MRLLTNLTNCEGNKVAKFKGARLMEATMKIVTLDRAREGLGVHIGGAVQRNRSSWH